MAEQYLKLLNVNSRPDYSGRYNLRNYNDSYSGRVFEIYNDKGPMVKLYTGNDVLDCFIYEQSQRGGKNPVKTYNLNKK